MSPPVMRWRRAAVAGVVVAVLIGVLGALAIPAAVRWGLETVASRELGRTVRLEDVSANPYTLRVTLKGVTVDGGPGGGEPLLSVREASINASLASLLRLAPVIEAVTLDGITANIVRTGPGRFNFSDIVARLQAKPDSAEPARFSLNNLEVSGSAINFDDRVTGERHALTDLRIGVPFLSNLPVDVETKVRPSLAGRIDGAPFEIAGETTPFKAGLDSSIAITLDGLHIPGYLALSPVPLDFDVPAGNLDADLRITFRQAVPATSDRPAQNARTLVSGRFAIEGFALAAPAGAGASPLVQWKSLRVAVEEFEPLQRRLVLAEVILDEPAVTVVRDDGGGINWLRFAERPLKGPPSASPAPDQPSVGRAEPARFAFTLKRGAVRNGRIGFTDEGVGFRQDVVNLQVDANGLTTTQPDRGKATLSADLKDNGHVALDGDVGLAPLAGRLHVAVRDVQLAAARGYLAGVLDGALDGTGSVDGILDLRPAESGTHLALTDLTVAGKGIRVRGPARTGAALDVASITASGGTVDMAARSVTIDAVAIDAPRALVRRLQDGSINWQRVFADTADARAPAARRSAAPERTPWQFRVDAVEIARGDVTVEDASVEPAVRLRATALSARAKNVTGDGSQPVQFDVRSRLAGGTLSAGGVARWATPSATVRIDARNLDIAALRPYLSDRLNATLARAEFSGRGRLAVSRPAAGTSIGLAYRGTARLSNLHLLDGNGENDLLKWQVLDVDGIDVQTGGAEPAVAVGKVTLSDFYARVILNEQGRLNLADLVRARSPAPAGGTDGQPAAVGPPGGREAADAASPGAVDAKARPADGADDGSPRPRIRVDAIELVRGNVNFTDNFIKPNYSANMTGLGGTVSSLASDSAEPAALNLAGEIDDEAPVEIVGRLDPLAPNLFLEIEGRTKGVDLPRMTPYAVKYAGYPILKGKLSMDVKYRLQDRKLQASNHLFLDQLTFGDRVESPTATKLPVLLAVSLLKNARGEIDINLPVSGSLDDPKFSVGGIIVQVIVNLLTKVVTAPFALLASAFGGSGELGYVEFGPGAAALGPSQQQRLGALARALNDRPALRLDIIGRVEPAADTEGVRRAKYESKLKAAKIRQLTRAGGESVDPATVTVGAQERPSLIAAVYSDEKIPDKPRNLIGLAKSIPTADMERLILKNLRVTPDDLRALATARAGAVRDHLEHTGKVPRERLFLVEPRLSAEGIQDKGAATRVDFSLK